MRAKQIIGKIHCWLGLSSGLVVFILGITGCLFCFQKELKDLFYHTRMFADSPVAGKPLPLDLLKNNAQAALGNQYPVTFIEYYPNSNRTVRFNASEYNENGLTYLTESVYNKTAFVNPFTGKVQAVEDSKWEFFNLVLQLHYNLLLNKTGHYIIGWSTVIFVIMLVTGIILWWPKNKAAIRQRLTLNWKKTTRWKRKNYDLHNVPGFYSLLFALCISLTGLWFAFDWFRTPVKWIINGGEPMPVSQPAFSDTSLTPLQNVLAKTIEYTEQEPIKGQFYFISISGEKTAPVNITAMLNKNNYARRSQYSFDRNSGLLLKKQTHAMKSGAEKFIFMIYDIHVGKVLGLPGQIAAFFASLIAASLPVTGFIIWRVRNKKKKLPQVLARSVVPA